MEVHHPWRQKDNKKEQEENLMDLGIRLTAISSLQYGSLMLMYQSFHQGQ
jgi:hypothetical protein